MDQYTNGVPAPKPAKKPYRGWLWKKRLPMAILGGAALPFTLFVGVFEMYAGNYEEFRFSFSDFAPLLILLCVGATLLLGGILFALRGRVFDVAVAVVTSVAFMASVQNMFLNVGIGSLAGDGLGMTIHPAWMVGNLLIWLAVIAGAVLAVLLVKKRKILRLCITVILVVLMGMQLPSLITLSLTTDVYQPKDQTVDASEVPTEVDTQEASGEATEGQTQGGEAVAPAPETETQASVADAGPKVLTTKNLYTVGSEKNIFVFVVDRFDVRYVDEIKESHPDYFEAWEDFVYYEDNITAYSRTYPAIGSMLSGKVNDFEKGVGAADYFYDAYQNSPLLNGLKEKDFSINLYTDDYYAYRDASEFEGLADNISGYTDYTVENKGGLCMELIALSAYRYSPVIAKPAFNVSTDSFEKFVSYDTEYPMYELNDIEVYAGLKEGGLTVGRHENHFSFIHLWGIHPPYRIGADGGKNTDGTSLSATLGCLEIVRLYISELKELGLYDNATIIITGDHPDPISDDVPPDIPRLTALFVKQAGESGRPFSESDAQVGQLNNFIPSILSEAGVSTEGECYWEVPENENRLRYYHFPVNPTATRGEYWVARFAVRGNGRDFANWSYDGDYSMNGFYYR